ncbi:unnamed protein product [Bemisia tabaci]|uniref:Uncharacterized protein n=1 Tax=Bemisia tabaci TaxID=7038 RepID=A0A9N9ZYE5_BEMTA|nr:unnamed protein product [Bemisia tabaci]
MECFELSRRFRIYRTLENNFSYKKLLFVVVTLLLIILYARPAFEPYFSSGDLNAVNFAGRCLDDRLTTFYYEVEEFDANIVHSPKRENEKDLLPFVGNGYFGIVVKNESPLYLKHGRVLSLPLNWSPLVRVEYLDDSEKASVVHFLSGITYGYECHERGSYVTHQYYAHRVIPSLFVQQIKISNPTSQNLYFNLIQKKHFNWPSDATRTKTFQDDLKNEIEYMVISETIPEPSKSKKVIVVSIITKKIPDRVEVKSLQDLNLNIFTVIHYSDPVDVSDVQKTKETTEKKAIEIISHVLRQSIDRLKQDHVLVWSQLWSTGFYVSTSKAADAINGDVINATMYYVLSHLRAPLHELTTGAKTKNEVINNLSYAEGCYGGHHQTFQAVNLWGDLTTLQEVNKVVSVWILTLEKQGCHKLMSAGANGAVQAMVLSYGSFRFSNQHLEFNIHPQFLDRDFLFRRLSYGNLTHVNVSVAIKEDNKAVLYVALDRSDRDYYACDGGCLDDPVLLSSEKVQFPVKLTKPVTAILYITYDKKHMEELRHTIHVKEVVEAPAHEHHVIALHKHGHHLGGLPTFFWVSVGFLIVVFHLFLFKLAYNEYFGIQDKYSRWRYGKL